MARRRLWQYWLGQVNMPNIGRSLLPQPLVGITVVAVEQAVAAPFCTSRLVDAGARVIKIEREDGDFARRYDGVAEGDASYFAWLNHGKESVVLDFKESGDSALLHRMIDGADVFVQNLAPGALARAGFSTDALRERNPMLVTCDISGYGEAPEVAGKLAYDLLVQAESGLVSVSGGRGELGRIGVSICDIGAGMTAHAAILEALIARSVHGHGASLRVSLFDVAAEWMTVPLLHEEYGDGGPKRQGLRHPSIAPYGAYATIEGALTLVSIQNEREWRRLCNDVLDRPGLADDPLFRTNDLRVENRDAMEEAIEAEVRTISAETFRQKLSDTAIAFGEISSVADLGRHRALRRREVTSSTGGVLSLPAHPVRGPMANSRGTAPAVPRTGADTHRIRTEYAPQERSD